MHRYSVYSGKVQQLFTPPDADSYRNMCHQKPHIAFLVVAILDSCLLSALVE